MAQKHDCNNDGDGWRSCPLTEKIDAMIESQKRIEHAVIGTGDPGSGLIVRVSLLEQVEARRTWGVRAALTAALAAIGGLVISLVRK
jgi:hypothetical protein